MLTESAPLGSRFTSPGSYNRSPLRSCQRKFSVMFVNGLYALAKLSDRPLAYVPNVALSTVRFVKSYATPIRGTTLFHVSTSRGSKLAAGNRVGQSGVTSFDCARTN